jgi:hypothetical protein
MRPVLIPASDVNSSTAEVTDWCVPDHSRVICGQIVAEVETSKAILDIASPADGLLLQVARKGAEIDLAEPVAYIFEEAVDLERYALDLERQRAEPTSPAHSGSRATAPAMARALELGVNLDAMSGQGIITVKMVEQVGAAAHATLGDVLDAPKDAERVLIIGAGLGATQVLEIFATGGGRQFGVGIVDDDVSRWGGEVEGVPVVGGTGHLAELQARGGFDAAVIAISTSVPVRTRLRLVCEKLAVPLTNVIDPTARICAGVTFGPGNVVCAFSHFGFGTKVGANNFVSAYNSYDHHNILGTDISTGPGCLTSGLVELGDRVRLGTGIFVEPHLRIGHDAQIASGSTIVSAVPDGHAVKSRVMTTVTVPRGRH